MTNVFDSHPTITVIAFKSKPFTKAKQPPPILSMVPNTSQVFLEEEYKKKELENYTSPASMMDASVEEPQ
jgi:hypothetical protein